MLKQLLTAPPVSLDRLDRVVAAPDLTAQNLAAAPLEPTIHTIEEVAARLRVSTKTVRRRIKDGTIRTVPMGGRLVRISSSELRRLIAGEGFGP